jgi:hypothetical protein
MSDFDISYPPKLVCGKCGKEYNGKDVIKDNEKLRTGTSLAIKSAPEKVKVYKQIIDANARHEAGKVNEHEWNLIIFKCNRKLVEMDNQTRGMTVGIDFACEDCGNPIVGDVKVTINVSVKDYMPTWEQHVHGIRMIDQKMRARIIADTKAENASRPLDFLNIDEMPKLSPIVERFLTDLDATTVDRHLFNEIEEAVKTIPSEAERLWHEKVQSIINAVESLAKKDAAREMPTTEEKLAAEADKLLGPLAPPRA